MVCKNRGIYGFLGASWVLITMAPRNNVRTLSLVGLCFNLLPGPLLYVVLLSLNCSLA